MARNASGTGNAAGGECDMSSKETAVRFARLHVRGSPLLLCDAADVGSFKAMALAGAPSHHRRPARISCGQVEPPDIRVIAENGRTEWSGVSVRSRFCARSTAFGNRLHRSSRRLMRSIYALWRSGEFPNASSSSASPISYSLSMISCERRRLSFPSWLATARAAPCV